MKLVIGLAVIFVCIITFAFLDAAKKADKKLRRVMGPSSNGRKQEE